MVEIDPSSEIGARALRHLAEDQVVWLTTVGSDGTPQPSLVWFIWNGETALIYSQPSAPKVRNIEGNPRVSLHFDSDGYGDDLVILTGNASFDEGAPRSDADSAFATKYAEGITRIGMTAESVGQSFSKAIRITPTRLRGH